ncbi:MAG: hypothetical protein AAGH15_19925 [Myxococcota bacterium]
MKHVSGDQASGLGYESKWLGEQLAFLMERAKRELGLRPDLEMTLLWRVPGEPECEQLVTRDDPDELIACLERMKAREAAGG